MATDHQTTNAAHQEHDQRPPRRASARRKAAKDPKRKKQPQRGMGVEKLERLRLQETPETDKPGFLHLPFSDMNHHPLHFARNPPAAYPAFQCGSDHRLLHNHLHLFGVNDSKLTVTGNVYSLHCNACHKKKKINGEMCRAGDHGKCGNKVHEVVAVHRKLGSCSGWDGGNRVLMEYDFFPAAKSGIDSNEGETAVMRQAAGFDDSDCVDLSLKLSY